MQKHKIKTVIKQAYFDIRIVAAAILGCRGAGLPSPAEKTFRKQMRFGIIAVRKKIHAVPGGKEATLYGRQGCLTLQFHFAPLR